MKLLAIKFVAKLVSLVTILALSTASLVSSSAQTPTYGTNSIGYIGCSNTMFTAEAYRLVTNSGRMWPKDARNYNLNQDTINVWANPLSSVWLQYDTMVAKYGQPQAVWIEVCENYQGTHQSITYNDIQQTLASLQIHSPGTIAYISPMNSYTDPVLLCNRIIAYPDPADNPPGYGSGNGLGHETIYSDQAVTDGLALPGPGAGGSALLGPLDYDTTVHGAQSCHPNTLGKTSILGPQIESFIDSL